MRSVAIKDFSPFPQPFHPSHSMEIDGYLKRREESNPGRPIRYSGEDIHCPSGGIPGLL